MDGFVDELRAVFAIENRKLVGKAQLMGMLAEDAIGDVVEGACPEVVRGLTKELFDAVNHLTCGFVGECAKQDPLGRNAILDETSHAVGQCAGFSTSSACDHEKLALSCRNHLGLLLV